jgi:targeting protein for Xklp2
VVKRPVPTEFEEFALTARLTPRPPQTPEPFEPFRARQISEELLHPSVDPREVMRSKVIAHQKPLTAPRSPMITKVTKIWQSPRRESPRHVSEQFPKEPTVPEPFPLRSEYLSAVYKKDFENRIQEELRQQKESAEFKALPLKIVPAFLPERSRKPLTETMNVQLRSDVRATQRATFDQQLETQRVEKEYILDHAKLDN